MSFFLSFSSLSFFIAANFLFFMRALVRSFVKVDPVFVI